MTRSRSMAMPATASGTDAPGGTSRAVSPKTTISDGAICAIGGRDVPIATPQVRLRAATGPALHERLVIGHGGAGRRGSHLRQPSSSSNSQI